MLAINFVLYEDVLLINILGQADACLHMYVSHGKNW